uniref:Nonsense-mediated mRNA decay factor SMG8 n=1 Tax=Lutzomyia longipalpis TaxID=7200 RepID=A0A7G3A9K2_LUTLO
MHGNKMEIFKNLPEYPSLSEKFLPGCSKDGRITFYADHQNQILYLHFETTYDNCVMMKILEEERFEHFVNFSTHIRTRFGRMLLFASQVCHIVVLVETQSAFDTTYLGLFRSLKVIREKYVLKFLPKFLKNSTAGCILGKEGRLCSPRFIFFFEDCPGECLDDPERLRKVEFEMEDDIYKMLRNDFIIMNNSANSLFSIPRNKRFVFVNTDQDVHSDPTVDALNHLMEFINKPSGRNSAVQEDEFDSIRPFRGFAKPLSAYGDAPEEETKRSFGNLIQEHVQEALRVGFDDSMAKFRGKSHFSAPTAKAWLETFRMLRKIFLENPDTPGFEANDPDYRAYLENFLRIMDIDERFFAECTDDGLEFATLHYHELLPHHYSRAFHEQKLAQSVELFEKYARGPRKGENETKLREVCEATWLTKQQCEAPSLTGNPCTLAKHTVTDPTQHSSGVLYVSTCNCGRTQGRREDPYTTKQANYDFYQILAANCLGCSKAEMYIFPIFEPSGVDFRAAEVVHEALQELYSEDESNAATQLTQNTHTDLSLKSLAEENLPRKSPEDVQEIVVKVGESPEKILRQHSTTEYLPGMVHTQSITGLLPQFPSWSLVCIGPSSIYSHTSGLPEHTQSGFLSGANFLIPWDVHVRLEHSASWAASYEKNRQRKRTKHHSADAGVVFQLKIFVGCEYECPRGHRFIMAAPDKILRGGGGSLVKDSGSKVVYSDMPLYFPCPCRTGKSLTAQLMRVHVVTPKAPVNVNLEPRVRIGARGSGITFTTGLPEPAKLSQSAYWILRLPYIYQGDDGPICPPTEVTAATASSYGCLLAGMYGVTETEGADGDSSINTARNPGILHIVLKVQGEAWDAEAVKKKMFEHVLERRNKDHTLAFPFMKRSLTRRWSHYAWADDASNFDIDNHVIFSQEGYRGRPITDANVQLFLSEQSSKFLPLNLPPWQITVVPIYQAQRAHSSFTDTPTPTMDHYYILLRFHHLLLSDMPNIRICDLLLVESGKAAAAAASRVTDEKEDEDVQDLPFSNLITTPMSIQELYSRITVAITNRWNEFIYRHDPLESPDGFKIRVKELPQLLSLLLIAGVCVLSDFWRGYHAIREHPSEKFKFFMSLVRREVRRRNLSWEIVGDCVLDAIDPIAITRRTIRGFFWLLGQAIVIVPFAIVRECMAIRCCLFLGHCGYPNTIIGFLFEFIPLVFAALREVFEALWLIVNAPKCLFESLMAGGGGKNTHGIQAATICGRKVISWSEVVERQCVKEGAKKFGASEAEVSLTMLAAAIRDALEGFSDAPIPKVVDISARSVHQDCLLGRMSRCYGVDGVICMPLPLGGGGKEHVVAMRRTLQEARRKNIALYTITAFETRRTVMTNVFTWMWIKLLTNYLSKKFCITVTDTVEDTRRRYRTLWGHHVSDMIYFRPPMANTSLSLTIQKFGTHIRVGVIADAELAPCHADIARSWTNYMQQFSRRESRTSRKHQQPEVSQRIY